MIYEIAHIIKNKFIFLWNIAEQTNSLIFDVLHKNKLYRLNDILLNISSEYIFRIANERDINNLINFFQEQPKEAFTFFKPHDFDYKSIKKIIKNKAFLTFIVTKDDKIVGYFFLRCFINGKCFLGKIVHKNWQGKGIAKLMGVAMTKVSEYLNLRMFGSISPENYASMASAKASNEIKVHKTLDNGYYYIEFLPKK